MLRVTQKPFRCSEFTDSIIHYISLNNKVGSQHNVGGINTATFKLNGTAEYRLTIYGQFNYGNLFEHITYEIFIQSSTYNRFEIRCVENTFVTQAAPFGISCQLDNIADTCELSITLLYDQYAGAFTFEWQRAGIMHDFKLDVKAISTTHKDLIHDNFDYILNYNDAGVNDGTNYILNQDTGGIIVSGFPNDFTARNSIKIPKRYKYIEVISNVAWRTVEAPGSDGVSSVYMPSVTFIPLSNTDTIWPFYGFRCQGTLTAGYNYNAPRYNIHMESTNFLVDGIEMGLKYDSEDKFNYYFHIDNPENPGDFRSYSDNHFTIIGCYNKQNSILGPVHSRSSEKKLHVNYTFNIISLPPSIYGGYNYGKCA